MLSSERIQSLIGLEGLLNKYPSEKQNLLKIEPYYKNFKGKIYPCDETNKKYIIKGCYTINGPDKITITELPIGTWTEDYKAFLETLLDNKSSKSGKDKVNYIKDYVDMSTEKNVEFNITFNSGCLNELLNEN